MGEPKANRHEGLLKNAILIAGPTASGKSALALRFAHERDGVIINADSMQVYDGLRLLTARPDDVDLNAADHRLYGHGPPEHAYSTAEWLRDVEGVVLKGRAPIFVGGTGLYFTSLTEGLSSMPAIPSEIRAHWRGRAQAEGAASLHAVLSERDPETAARLRNTDGQRIVRALEVLEASERSILHWQQQRETPLVDLASARAIVIEPERQALAERIARRFDLMMEQGALAEAESLLSRKLDPLLPIMKAIGLRELGAYLDGEFSIDEAISRAKTATRQYAKRQMTWFRNQFGPEWQRVPMG
ncbi:tRNA (adenosine(37)-N6)-dimethylallyltransferase MiaA [Mesorhizobium denitrificans]|uniref:tRNA dimethylallyltransferase n=2 Tax=Phyllobacteriaceae TaxID=69277 RepID=A0A371XG30_9HYPH|nr:tRNA (adenosine(37)-N6)-dimethylallyltransferase MiaA [Mesorhizobium denitrificans]